MSQDAEGRHPNDKSGSLAQVPDLTQFPNPKPSDGRRACPGRKEAERVQQDPMERIPLSLPPGGSWSLTGHWGERIRIVLRTRDFKQP